MAAVATNKNTIPGDTSALTPGGIRMGSCALTSRGLEEDDFNQVATFFDRGVAIAGDLKADPALKKLKDFKAACEAKGLDVHPDLKALREDVSNFANSFPTVGFEEKDMVNEGSYLGEFAA